MAASHSARRRLWEYRCAQNAHQHAVEIRRACRGLRGGRHARRQGRCGSSVVCVCVSAYVCGGGVGWGAPTCLRAEGVGLSSWGGEEGRRPKNRSVITLDFRLRVGSLHTLHEHKHAYSRMHECRRGALRIVRGVITKGQRTPRLHVRLHPGQQCQSTHARTRIHAHTSASASPLPTRPRQNLRPDPDFSFSLLLLLLLLLLILFLLILLFFLLAPVRLFVLLLPILLLILLSLPIHRRRRRRRRRRRLRTSRCCRCRVKSAEECCATAERR